MQNFRLKCLIFPWINLIISWIFLIGMKDSTFPPPGFVAPHIRRGRYIFLERADRCPIALVCAGHEECGAHFSVDRPSFRWHALELLMTGSWEVRQAARWVAAGPGTVVSYGPRQAGGIRATGHGPHAKYFVDFRGSASRRYLQLARVSAGRLRSLGDLGGIADLCEQILSCSALPAPERPRVTAVLLQALLVRLRAEPDEDGNPRSQRRRVFERCRSYLTLHYAEAGGPGAAARACHVGPEYLSRLFREYAGQTPSFFLARLRMQHAARLLQQPGLSVKATARAVGFDDPYHFSRVFKRIHGVAPRHFKTAGGPQHGNASGHRSRCATD